MIGLFFDIWGKSISFGVNLSPSTWSLTYDSNVILPEHDSYMSMHKFLFFLWTYVETDISE